MRSASGHTPTSLNGSPSVVAAHSNRLILYFAVHFQTLACMFSGRDAVVSGRHVHSAWPRCLLQHTVLLLTSTQYQHSNTFVINDIHLQFMKPRCTSQKWARWRFRVGLCGVKK
jgi:hypothetical protein